MAGTTIPFRYSEKSGEVTITQFTGDSENVDIPDRIGELPVTAVGSYAFRSGGEGVRRIRVPGTVKKILPHAFELCIELKELILEEGVEELGEDCLLGSGIENLFIPSTLRKIRSPETLPCRVLVHGDNRTFSTDGYGLYRGDELIAVNSLDTPETYAVREGTRSIRMGVFDGRRSLRTIHLPASLTEVGEGLFSNNRNQYSAESGITDVTVAPGNARFQRTKNALIERGDGVKIIRWFGDEEEIDLPGDTEEIGREAFSGRKARIITFPGTLSSIAPDAFLGCPLREIRARGGEFGAVFPSGNAYLLKDLLRGFGRNSKYYDFSSYDGMLGAWVPDRDRIEMMLARLRMPCDLPGERAAAYREMIGSHAEDVVRIAAANRDMDLLTAFGEEGFLEGETAEYAVRYLNEAGLPGMAAYALRKKHEAGASGDFDFSL